MLLTPYDFLHRTQYVHARETFARLLDLGVVPVVNENDTVADDEIRFGDNDRIAALVANLIRADVLVMLTDTAGLFTADPRLDGEASLIEQIAAVDEALDAAVGGAGSARGSGGMATKLAAARIAAWSGVRAVIAAADAPGVVTDAIAGRGVGTEVAAASRAAHEPQALDRVRGRCVRPGRRRRRRPPRARVRRTVAARRRCARRRGRVRGRERGRGRRRVGPGVRQGPRHDGRGRGPRRRRAPDRRPARRARPTEVIHRDDLVVLQ